jgi:hypothetical protein
MHLFCNVFSLCHPERSEGSGTPGNLKRSAHAAIEFLIEAGHPVLKHA